jgi:hypothetical protein
MTNTDRLAQALRIVRDWILPDSQRKWPDGRPMSYGDAFGSTGESQYMRTIAAEALAEHDALASLAPAIPCLGCDSLQCKDCFARHAEETGYVRVAVDAAPVAWITQDDLRQLLAKEDNVIACAFFEGVQQNYVSLYTAAQVAALTAQCATYKIALLDCARQAEALKRPCGDDPESPQAIRNGQYANISHTAHIALGTIKGPAAGNGEGV